MKQILLSFCVFYQFAQSQPLPPLTQPVALPPGSVNTLPSVVDPLPINPQPPIVEPLPLPQPPHTNPLPTLPEGQAYGAFGQLCDVHPISLCQTPTDTLSSLNYVTCDGAFACCLCASIECTDCITFVAGDSGVFGVDAITISGRDAQTGGAEVECQGTESCSESVITGTNIKTMTVSGDMGSKNAVITITDPSPDFKLECSGLASCEALRIEIVIPAPAAGIVCEESTEPFFINAIECKGAESCKNMDITIRNDGCDKVLIENLECTELDSCIGTNFNFIGDIDTVHCNLGASGHTATGISKCYQNLQALLCQDPESCRGIVKTLTNPNNAFSLECDSFGSCSRSELTINLNASPWWDPIRGSAFKEHTSWLNGFKFNGEASAAMATIIINNQQRGKVLQIERIECVSINSCAFATFIIGENVEIVNLLCYDATCTGCLVKVSATDVGVPCAEYTIGV